MEEFLGLALTLFLVMDPVGNTPLFLAVLRHIDPARRRVIVIRESLIALVIMVVFMVAGNQMLNLLHVTQPALSAAGGLVLLLIAIKMVFPSPESPLHEPEDDEPLIVPLAMPLFAGPSVLAATVIFSSQFPGQWTFLLGALVGAWLVSAIILYCSSWLQQLLGDRVLKALERLMGMILVVLATQMLLDGIKSFFVD